MTALPEPVPLPDPPGDPGALGELIDGWSSAAFHVGVLHAHLGSSAATAPGWRGRDADAAGVQVRTATGMARGLHDMLTAALARLGSHRDLLEWTCGEVRKLRSAQQDDVQQARIRLSQAVASLGVTAAGNPPPDAVAVCEDLAAAELARQRAHAMLLDDVAADSAATVRELTRVLGVVGATGRPDDGVRVTLRLAAVLPGWGAQRMSALGAEAVSSLSRSVPPDELDAVLSEYLPYAADPDFAAAFLGSLGPGGVLGLLQVLGSRAQERTGTGAREPLPDPLADLLGRAMGGLERSEQAVPGVLHDVLVDPSDPSGAPDLVAAGMGAALSSGAVGARVARDWAGQLIAREAAIGRRSIEALTWWTVDPLPLALATVAGDPAVAADLVGDPSFWSVAVTRLWEDDGASLASAVRAAAHASAGAADEAALVTLAGLAGALPDVLGDVDDNARSAAFVGAVSEAAASLVAARLDAVLLPVVAALGARRVAAVPLSDAHVDALAGLGLVSVDPSARATVLKALTSWAVARELPAADASSDPIAYAQGAVFATLASGERQRQQLGLIADVRAAQTARDVYDIVTLPLGMIKYVGDAVSVAGVFTPPWEPDDPTDRVLEEMFVQPRTRAAAARWAAVVAALPRLVEAGRLPHPGSLLDEGLDSPSARTYEASLDAAQDDVWKELLQGADAGFNAVGDLLDVLPGTPAAARPAVGGR